MLGQAGQTTINQANIAQSLFTQPTRVRSATIYPGSANTGNFLVSYGGAPVLPALTLPASPGQWYDLAMVQIQSTVAGDKAAWNLIYKP